MKPKLVILCFLGVLSIAVALRLPDLATVPAGLNWDETAYAYNAYSLWKTGADEWGITLPILLRSFGENKPALFSYLLIPLYMLLGAETATVRLAAALLGVIGVMATFGIVHRLSKSLSLATITALLLAVTPWHLYHSRAAMDPILGHGFLLLGYWIWIRPGKLSSLIGASLLALSMYGYNAERVFVPLFLLVSTLILHRSKLRTELFHRWPGYLVFAVTASIIMVATLVGPAGSRSRTVSIFAEHLTESARTEQTNKLQKMGLPIMPFSNNHWLLTLNTFAKNYAQHFRPDFLFFPGGNLANLSFTKYGNLLASWSIFFVIGLAVAIRTNSKINSTFLIWLILAPVPSSLTQDVPHAGRALIMVPALNYFVALGITSVVGFREHPMWKWISGISIAGWLSYTAIAFIITFWAFFPEESYHSFQGYNPVLAQKIMLYEADSSSVVITNTYDYHSLLFLAWYTKMDPLIVQHGLRNNILLSTAGKFSILPDQLSPACALSTSDSLVVLTPDQSTLVQSPPLDSVPFGTTPQAAPGLQLYDTDAISEADKERVRLECDMQQQSLVDAL